jgi:hypothetical protein
LDRLGARLEQVQKVLVRVKSVFPLFEAAMKEEALWKQLFQRLETPFCGTEESVGLIF